MSQCELLWLPEPSAFCISGSKFVFYWIYHLNKAEAASNFLWVFAASFLSYFNKSFQITSFGYNQTGYFQRIKKGCHVDMCDQIWLIVWQIEAKRHDVKNWVPCYIFHCFRSKSRFFTQRLRLMEERENYFRAIFT